MKAHIPITRHPHILRANPLTHNYCVFIFWWITISKFNAFKVLFFKKTIQIREVTVRTIHTEAPSLHQQLNRPYKVTIVIHSIKVPFHNPVRIRIRVWLPK